MQQIKEHYSTLLSQNWSPDRVDARYDVAMFPILLAAENKRSPNLNLTWLTRGPTPEFGEWLANWQLHKRQSHARVMFVMSGFSAHHVTADVKRDKQGDISVLIVEPLGFKANAKQLYETAALPALGRLLDLKMFKGKVALTVLALDTMKSDIGCRIFGLSAASKMAKEGRLFDMLHEQNLSGQIKTSTGGDANVLASSGRVKIVDGKGVLPISFFKHSESKTTLEDYLRKNPPGYANVLVNKHEKPLMERYNDHQTTRYKDPVRVKYAQMANLQPKVERLRIGTSIESKRLTYIDRAIEFLKGASDSEMKALKQLMGGDLRLIDTPEPGKLYIERRALGPSPNRLSPADG